MRALELLYQYKQADEIAGGYLSKPIDEAIKELEELEAYKIKLSSLTNENNSLVKTLEKYNEEMIKLRIENQELKERIKDDI